MKQIFFHSVLLMVLVFSSCKKDEDPIFTYNTESLKGYRGDTVYIPSSNFNPDVARVLLTSFYNEVTKSMDCQLVPAGDNRLGFIIPYDIMYYDDEISSYLVSGDGSVTIEIFEGSNLAHTAGLQIQFAPRVDEAGISTRLNYSDLLTITGVDLDIRTLSVIFNSLQAKIVEQTSRKVVVQVPDSCGNGDLRISCSNIHWDGDIIRNLYQEEYEINFTPNYKLPKRVQSTWNGTEYFEYDMFFNSNHQLDSFDVFNAVGDQHKRRSKTYEYNEENKLCKSLYYFDGDIIQKALFTYSDNKITETIYTEQSVEIPSVDPFVPPAVVDSFMPYTIIEYTLDDQGRIVSSTYTSKLSETGEFVTHAKHVFDFISDKECYLTETIISSSWVDGTHETHEFSYEYLITYNNLNPGVPLQLKTFKDGLYLPGGNDLDYVLFPGSMIYQERVTYTGDTDVDLYYDQGGNLVKEAYYYIAHYGAERELIRSSVWEY